ncbi:hypothetical protein [Arthrobacter sp. D2-10]
MPKNDQQGSAQDAQEVNTPTPAQQDVKPDQPEPAEDVKGGNKEAAKYRRQLRDTEAERDALVETVAGLQRQLVAGNLPPGSKMNAEALWTAGRKPGDFFENGQLDAEKLKIAVKEVHTELGVRFGPDPIHESGGGSGLGLREKPATLADEVRKRRG